MKISSFEKVTTFFVDVEDYDDKYEPTLKRENGEWYGRFLWENHWHLVEPEQLEALFQEQIDEQAQ